MKVTAIALFCLVAVTGAAPAVHSRAHDWKWEVTVDVFEGTIEGFFSNFKDLKSCANDTVTAYDEIRDAVGLIEQKTPSSVLQGIKDLGTALEALKSGLVDCKAATTEIKQFVKGFSQFKSPLSFAFHVGKDLLINGQDIYSEITQAVSLWKSQSYLDAGIQIGEALNKLIVGDKWRHYAVHSSFGNGPSPKSKCALKCTAEALAVYWKCAGDCVAKQAPNSCITVKCPATVAAFDVPCLKQCKNSVAATQEMNLHGGSDFVVADMHDGDKKRLTFHDFTKASTGLTIRPYGNNQTWVVETSMSNVNNEAVVDFNVPNKPNPPPVNLTLTLKMLSRTKMAPGKVPRACVFTDPSGTLADKDYPLNVWVELDTRPAE